MKPNTQLPQQSAHLEGGFSSPRTRVNQPRVDYHFRTPQEEPQIRGSGTNQEQTKPESAPKFSDLSSSVFGIHAKRNFVGEALLFAVIAAIAAFPIVLAIYVLSQTVY